MEQLSFNSNIIKHIDPGVFLTGEAAYEFPLYIPPVDRFNQIDNRITINGETTTQAIGVKTKSYVITSLRAYVNILSLPLVPPVVAEVTDDDLAIAIKNNDNDMQYPGIAMDLIMKAGPLRAITGQFRLQNKRPGYWINLMRFLTSQNYFYGGLETSIIVRFRDLGDGLPRLDDSIYFYGEVEEIGYFANVTQARSDNTVTLSGSVNATLSGSLNTSTGGGTGGAGEEVTPSFTATLTTDNLPNEILLYYLPDFDPNAPTEVGNAWSWSFVPEARESQFDFTQQLNGFGAGYYFICATNSYFSDQFWGNLYLFSSTIQPDDRASILSAQATDTTRNYTTPSSVYVVHVTNPAVAVALQLEI